MTQYWSCYLARKKLFIIDINTKIGYNKKLFSTCIFSNLPDSVLSETWQSEVRLHTLNFTFMTENITYTTTTNSSILLKHSAIYI